MAMLGTITQLPRTFFQHAATLAGAENEKEARSEQAEIVVSDHEADETAATTMENR